MSARHDEVTADVSARLARICPHFSAEAFAALVRDVVSVTLRFEGSATPTDFERGAARLRHGDPPTDPRDA